MRTAWGNPNASHPQGAAARTYIEQARGRVLAALGDRTNAGDILWTSGCTEASTLAVLGAARARDAGAIVVSAVEHPAVATAAAQLAPARSVVTLAVGRDGIVDPAAAADAARSAAVAAIVMVQNELGTVQPVAAIAAAIKRANPSCHVHVDAAQAFGKIALDVTSLHADSIAIGGHKLHGPKGTGALWLRTGLTLAPLWTGGGQQRGLRGGTQDAPGIAGLGLAAERAAAALPAMRAHWLELANLVTQRLDAAGVEYRQLVPDVRRAPHILALGFRGVPAPALRTVLSSRGVYVSTGSACAERREGNDRPSPALEAIGLPPEVGTCRLSFAHDTTADEVERAISILVEVVATLRK
jgi:cysteine desulfurase